MRGEVLQYDDQSGQGLISGEDGVRYAFTRANLQHLVLPKPGAKVDFVPMDGVATQIYMIDAALGIAAMATAAAGPQRSVWEHFTFCMKNYVNGVGRANRAEYWSFTLFVLLFYVAALIVDAIISASVNGGGGGSTFLPIFFCITALVFLLPALCVQIRRFHDVGLTGWLILIGIVPYVGSLFTFVVTVLAGQAGPNKHGPGPGQSFP